MRIGLADISSTALCVFKKNAAARDCSGLFRLYVDGKFTEHFHFPVLHRCPLYLTEVSIRFCSWAVTPPTLGALFLGSVL